MFQNVFGGNRLQAAVEIEEIAAGPAKGKTDKGKKMAKKPPTKGDLVEVRMVYGVLCMHA